MSRMAPSERLRFGDYLRSPLHSHRPQLAEMLLHLEALLLDGEDSGCSNEAYWEAVYPGKPYNGNLLNRLLSEMTAELKGFLALLRYQSDPAARQINLLQEFRHRGWQDVVPRALKEARQKLDHDLPQDEHYYYHRLQLAVEQLDYDSDHMGRDPGPIYQDVLDNLDYFYSLWKLRYFCSATYHDRLHSRGHTIRFPGFFEELKHENKLLKDPRILLRYKLFRFLKDLKNDALLETFIQDLLQIDPEQLDNQRASYSYDELDDFFRHAINACTNRLNSGDTRWIDFYIQLNLAGLAMGLFLQNGQLSERDFLNISGSMSKHGRPLESMEFIKKYSSKMIDGESNPALFLSKGINWFYQEDYHKANSYFLKGKNTISAKTDFGTSVAIRSLLCRVKYELDDVEGMMYEVHSFRVFINRTKRFSKARLAPYIKFCKILLKLERTIAIPNTKIRIEKLEALREIIEEDRFISGANWLKRVFLLEMNKANPQ